MAVKKIVVHRIKRRTHRKGVHSKNNTSRLKNSKIYKKKYKGQGR
jgi:hypothetical protein